MALSEAYLRGGMDMSRLKRHLQLFFRSLLLLALSFLIKRKEDYVALGSWCGDRYVDNSRYFAEYLQENRPDLKLFWVGNAKIRAEVEENLRSVTFLEKDTLSSDLALLRCKYMFCTQMHSADLSLSNVCRNAEICYFHHGIPIKKIGEDAVPHGEKPHDSICKRIYDAVTGSSAHYAFFASASPLNDAINLTSMPFRGSSAEKNIPAGTPRNDMLVNYDSHAASALKKRYARELGFDETKRVVLYLPTYRRVSNDIFSFSRLTPEQNADLRRVLQKNDLVLIEKSHVAESVETHGVNTDDLLFVDRDLNVQEMLLFADFMISDYSGAFLDFTLLDRPVIHFVYDYEFYKNTDSGLYFELEEFAAGRAVRTFDELLDEIDRLGQGIDGYADKRRAVRGRFLAYETGHASEQIADHIFGKIAADKRGIS